MTFGHPPKHLVNQVDGLFGTEHFWREAIHKGAVGHSRIPYATGLTGLLLQLLS